MKNLCNRRRDISDPYEIWEGDGFEFRVLKKYQADDDREFARWYCAVKSPFTHDMYEFGDSYVIDIKKYARRVR